jgi:hypothetical protein
MEFLPKRSMNVCENELARALKHKGESIDCISFKMPRRFGQLQPFDSDDVEKITYEQWEESPNFSNNVYQDFEDQLRTGSTRDPQNKYRGYGTPVTSYENSNSNAN